MICKTAPASTIYVAKDFISYDMSGSTHSSNLINSIVVPRPIALITSKGLNGVINAAPFSYFNRLYRTTYSLYCHSAAQWEA